jgi:Chaperone of endosialidase
MEEAERTERTAERGADFACQGGGIFRKNLVKTPSGSSLCSNLKSQNQTAKKRKATSMNPLAQLKKTTAFCLVVFALACFAFSPEAQALKPAPDGGYPNHNTAEGDNALLSLTTGEANTAVGFDALASNTTGTSNTACGAGSLVFNTTGSANTADGFRALKYNTANFNTAVGFETLFFNTTGAQNTATGTGALENNTTGSNNTADGFQALFHNTTGAGNTALGFHALVNNSNGSSNIALGLNAGTNLTTGSNNIDIGNSGVGGESNTIRIGSVQIRTFIKGISGVGVTGTAVVVNSSGQLGTAPSSQRFKDDIKPMDKASEAILALKPVTFRYKPELDPENIPQFGLVAEEVEKVNPALVARDAKGQIYTVRYDAVNAMLLNEFLKEHKGFVEAQHKVEKLETTVATLVATVKEQAAQIQKVSAQLEVSKAAPQTVANNQ